MQSRNKSDIDRYMESRGSKHTLIIRKIEKEDFANYSCYATNTLGRAKAFVYLRGLYITWT
jgi:neuronal growth regulator 1